MITPDDFRRPRTASLIRCATPLHACIAKFGQHTLASRPSPPPSSPLSSLSQPLGAPAASAAELAYELTAISMRRPLDARVLEAIFDAGAMPGAMPGADADAFCAHHGAVLLRPEAVLMPTTALPTTALSITALPMALLEARTRGAFLRFLASLLRDLPCFLSEASAKALPTTALPTAALPTTALAAAEAGAARCDGRDQPMALAEQLALAAGLDEQLDCFVRAQPIASQPFLQELCRTQLFLCFVQPADPPADALPAAGVGDEAAGAVGRDGGSSELVRDAHLERELRLRCFELVRDAHLEREMRLAAERERQHGSLPTSVEWEAIGAAHHGAVHHGAAHHGAAHHGAAHHGVPLTNSTVDDFDVPLPRVRPGTPDPRVYGADTEVWPQIASGASSSARERFTYPEGAFPIELPHNLWAAPAPAPPFAPAVASARAARARLSPDVRAVWSAALAELEARHAKRVGAQVAASAVGGAIVVGGAVAASMLGCSVQ